MSAYEVVWRGDLWREQRIVPPPMPTPTVTVQPRIRPQDVDRWVLKQLDTRGPLALSDLLPTCPWSSRTLYGSLERLQDDDRIMGADVPRKLQRGKYQRVYAIVRSRT